MNMPDRFDEEAEMQTQTTETFEHATGEKSTTVARSGWNWSRIRPIAFWATTFVIVFELIAGSVWNLLPIEWVEVQLRHLGYPHYFAYILGVWQAGAAVAIIAPRLPMIKAWAYAGAFFLWSSAVASHLIVGDGLQAWGAPLVFGTCAIASWVLRPADRRLPETRLHRDRPANAGQNGAGSPETRPRAWAVPIGLLVVLYAVSFLTLPAAEAMTHKWSVENGWIDE
ncbi:DoxX family protein [Streptosporangium roseum]|uniref:DoxX family protein n=1 Tax=Streptosporangium roseum TaxID=2001 RepID=UPI0018CC0CB1|nr:DoxX family protein [Streptosporangium roseum]